MKKQYNNIIMVMMIGVLCLFSFQVNARNISFIRDTEIENTIRLYTKPIFDAAGLNSNAVQVFIINDDGLNAFVTNGQKIFLNSGTLRYSGTPEQVMGVIAHEAGHITGGHMSKMYEQFEKAQAITIASVLLGIPIAIATGRGDVAMAATSLGVTAAERDFLSYSRENEQAADHAGVEFLNKAGIDPSGLYDFMDLIDNKSKLYQGGVPDPYRMTHPLTQERLEFLEFIKENSSYKGKKLADFYYLLHDRMRTKLEAFIDDPESVLRKYPEQDQGDMANYARSIAYMRWAKFNLAHNEIDKLIIKYPQDPFYLELKGDIYRDAGDLKSAQAIYEKVITILPWAALVRISLAHVLVEMKDTKTDDLALIQLNEAKVYETDNANLWRYLGVIYERRNDLGMLAFVSAEASLRSSDFTRAQRHAEEALNRLPRSSTAWQRARDIYNQSKFEIENRIKKQ